MSFLGRLLGSTRGRNKPFYLNKTREERQDWFASTPPWDRVSSPVIDAILDGISDKVTLEAFVIASTEQNLVGSYEHLGMDDRISDDPTTIRAAISGILCQAGSRVIASLMKAFKEKQMDKAGELAALAQNSFEPAITLAKNQISAYMGLAQLYGIAGKRDECRDWAKRGLAELTEMRSVEAALQSSTLFPPDMLDQAEQQLRQYSDADDAHQIALIRASFRSI
jgi:hypothetical protein